ncbi:MAG TPA: histidine--tRNA ligase [Gaiellaceae bacterium]|nr:histidine--tRNA ligase [Gaiellaceae bacterium]
MKSEAPRGTLDVLPADQPSREAVVGAAEEVARLYGYGRVVTPTFEDTDLFVRTSGRGSDVVQKEMYTFTDRAGRSLTLRPEGTAPVARAYLQHGLHRAPQPVKTFYVGPMFRYATPQRGRYREFWQVGFEAIGSEDPAVDAELVQLFTEIERRAGFTHTRLELNSIGDRACRPAYVERLRAFLAERGGELDEETRRRGEVSPLRVFDTKHPASARVLAEAPTIGESLCDDCRAHFAEVRRFLDAYGIEYVLVPTLVRGLDYYTRTVFEFVNEGLDAAQATTCAGGRYDYLIEEIGGAPTPGVGWAAGVERMVMSLRDVPEQPGLDVFVVCDEGADRPAVLAQLAELRRAGLSADADYAGRSLKGQMTQAGRTGARLVVRVTGEEATLRSAGADLGEPFPAAELASVVLGHPGPPPALEPNEQKRARGAQDVPEA